MWKNDKRDGLGCLKYNGYEVIGTWADDEISKGFEQSDKGVFMGDFTDGKRGEGVLVNKRE
jgi:hypothetical protein